MLNIPFPRLLPLTIVGLSALLVLKLLVLLQIVQADSPAAVPLLTTGVTMVSTAHAASAEPETAATPAASAPKPTPRPSGAPGPDGATAAEARPPAEKSMADKAASEKSMADKSMTDKPAGEKPGEKTAAAAMPAMASVAEPSAPPPISDTERAVLLDLRTRRRELDAREAGLQSRETMLVAAEHRLSARIDELTALQGRLEALEKARKEREENNWRGLVKIYEDMRPRDAASIFNGLDMTVLLQVLDRMKESRSAPILAAMQPDKARQATSQLADMRLKNNTIGG